MTILADRKCMPVEKGTPALSGEGLKEMVTLLGGDWKVIEDHQLEKEFTFKNFEDGLAFTIQIGSIAGQQDHHPDIYLSWGKVKITLWTHSIDGLSEADFILAAKIDLLQ